MSGEDVIQSSDSNVIVIMVVEIPFHILTPNVKTHLARKWLLATAALYPIGLS